MVWTKIWTSTKDCLNLVWNHWTKRRVWYTHGSHLVQMLHFTEVILVLAQGHKGSKRQESNNFERNQSKYWKEFELYPVDNKGNTERFWAEVISHTCDKDSDIHAVLLDSTASSQMSFFYPQMHKYTRIYYSYYFSLSFHIAC